MDVEAEIRELKRRVGALEGSFGFLTEQVKGIHKDLLGFQANAEKRFDRIENDVAEIKGDMRQVKSDVGLLQRDVRTLREDLPGIVGDAVREATGRT